MRPCRKEHPPSPDTCRLCYLYINDPAYRALWDGQPPRRCPHLYKRVRDQQGQVVTRVCKTAG